MLAAHAQLESGLGTAATQHRILHQLAHTALIDGLERVALEQPLLQVLVHHAAFHVVTAEAERHLGEVVGAVGEEIGLLGNLIGAYCGTRCFHHGADGDVEGLGGGLVHLGLGFGHCLLHPTASQSQLLAGHGERDHDLHHGFAALGHSLGGGLHEGTDLHLVQPRLHHTKADTAGAEHGVEFVPTLGRRQQLLLPLGEAFGGLLDTEVLGLGQELVQRRVEQADGDGQAVHLAQDVLEVGLLGHPKGLQRLFFLLVGFGQDHGPHDGEAVLGQEHVLGAAQAHTLSAELPGVLGIGTVVGIGAHLEATDALATLADHVGPAQDDMELLRRFRRRHGQCPQHHFAGGAIDGDDIAALHGDIAHAEGAFTELDLLGPHHRWRAPSSGHHGGVTHQTASGGEDAFGHQHAVDVFGAGLRTHQDHRRALVALGHGIVSGEHHGTNGGAGRSAQAFGEHLGLACELGMQHLIQGVSRDPQYRFFSGNLPLGLARWLGGHVHRHAQGGRTGALAHPGLQHPELALFDGELGVAHVAIVRFQSFEDGHQLRITHGESVLEIVQGGGVADTGHHIFALGIDQIITVRHVVTGTGIAGETNPGTRVVIEITEHHGLHVDGGAQFVRDPLTNAIGNGPSTVPALEYRFHGAAQLCFWILGEFRFGFALHDFLEVIAHLTQ